MFNQWKGLNKGNAPEREDIVSWADVGVELHPDTVELVHDSQALERAFGGNGQSPYLSTLPSARGMC